MDYYQDPAVAAMLRGSSKGPPPRRGENREFDQYCDRMMDNLDAEETDFSEMRRAAWATYGVGAPTRSNGQSSTSHTDEDAELARILALSAREHDERSAGNTSTLPEGLSLDDDDDELRRAIAMSEEESRAPKRQKREETPEEERKMLADAMTASLAHEVADISGTTLSSDDDEVAEVDTAAPAIHTIPVALPSVLSGRAQMEQERLARQRAREGSGPTPKAGPEPGIAALGSKSVPAASSSRIATMADIGNGDANASSTSSSTASGSRPRKTNGDSKATQPSSFHPLQSSGPFPTDAAGEYYLDGELRHIALTIGKQSDAPTFSPRQVIGSHAEISLLVMCSFCIDDEWLNQILPPPGLVPTVLIRPHPKEKADWNGKVQVQPNGEVWAYPRMTGQWGSAHMKFFWIFYKTGRVRVVISTANMVDYDWDWIENTVFIQDFLPQISGPSPRTSPLGDEFVNQFRDLLIHMKVHKAIRHQVENHPFGKRIPLEPSEALQDLSKYDFSRVRVKLVMSVPGKYTGFDQMNEYGLCRLGNLLKEEKWVPPAGQRVEGEYQGSSLGSYTLEWIDTFHRFMNGREARDLVGRPKAKEWPPMKVLFPSVDTVRKSELGNEGGGTMFVGQSWKAVTQRLFHDANSKRGGVLMHSKVLIALFEKQPNPLGAIDTATEAGGSKLKRKADELNEPNIGGWAYVGSHNFTPAAWGNVRLNDRPPTMSITNYELGIVFPLPRDNAKAAADAIAPYKRPARPYDPNDTPWDQSVLREGKLKMHTPK